MIDSATSLLCRAAAAASCNRGALLREIVDAALHAGVPPEALYEDLLQTYLFAGFPAALEGLRTLRDALREADIAWTPLPLERFDVERFRSRGEALYRKVYSSNHEPLQRAVESFSPDMFNYMILEGYGKVLSRPGLTGPQRELATVTALAALGWGRQVISHARGAINLGATTQDVFDAIALAAECSNAERAKTMRDVVTPHVQREL